MMNRQFETTLRRDIQAKSVGAKRRLGSLATVESLAQPGSYCARRSGVGRIRQPGHPLEELLALRVHGQARVVD